MTSDMRKHTVLDINGYRSRTNRNGDFAKRITAGIDAL